MKKIAIHVQNVSKIFEIPHEKITTLRTAFVRLFSKKTYEKFYALQDVSFEIYQGEFFAIIGKNGSGKSTLLKILADIFEPDHGTIKINGEISPFLELGVGFNPELSGRDNVYLNGLVLGLSKKQIQERFDAIVAFSELERFIDQKVKKYSSGMYSRLAFSVAIHANKDILIMDEVLAVGDADFQKKCMEKMKLLHEQGKTIILVTHSEGSVLDLADRALLLEYGKVITIGRPKEVIDYYNNQD